MEMVRGGPVKQVSDGSLHGLPWLLWFARYRCCQTSKVASCKALRITIRCFSPLGQLPLGEITLPQVGAVPMAELQRDMERLSAEQLWLLRAAVAGSLANRGK
jgi:hypothetical protein